MATNKEKPTVNKIEIIIDSIFKEYGARAKAMLEDKEFREASISHAKTILTKERAADQIEHLKEVVFCSKQAREYMKQNNAVGTAHFTMLLFGALKELDWIKHESHFLRGITILEAAKKSGQGRAEEIKVEREPVWRKWQQIADDIWREHPDWSKINVARHILKRLKGMKADNELFDSIETIRRRIEKKT